MLKLCYFLSFFFFMFSSCGQRSGDNNLYPTEFHAQLQKSDQPILLDVRTPEEFDESRLPNAVNLNFYDENFAERIGHFDKEQPIFIYCHSGSRSKNTADKLIKMGFQQIYHLDGGIVAWESEGLEVEK